MDDLPVSVADAVAQLRAGSVTSRELTSLALETARVADDRLGVFAARFDHDALAAATIADEERKRGVDRGRLHGIPIAIKDIITTSEGPTRAQSVVSDTGWETGADAPAVARLRSAGAVIIGKTSTAEFALGAPDSSKPFPVPRNPWNDSLYPGASSSGSASGVAAGMFLVGIGTDTGGSIRIPAAWCGVTGFKPTFGLVPKSGCIPVGYSVDCIGPIASSAWDCAATLSVIAGADSSDPSTVHRPPVDYVGGLTEQLHGMRIGVASVPLPSERVDPILGARFSAAVDALSALGAEVTEVELPYWNELQVANRITLVAEAATYHHDRLRSHWPDFYETSRALLAQSALISATDYIQAQRVRRVAQAAIGRLFESVDVVASVTAATGAFACDDRPGHSNFEAMASTWFGSYWNPVGNPAIAIPMGFSADGLPLSMQLAGPAFEDLLVLRVAHAYQSVTDWHSRRPQLDTSSSPAWTDDD